MKKIRSFSNALDVVTVGVVHDLNLAARFADQIIVIDDGRVVAAGTPEEVLTIERIQEIFGVVASILTDKNGSMQLVFD